MAAPAKPKRIVLVSTDKVFLQETKAAFATSDHIQLLVVEKQVMDLRGEIQEADCGAVIIDMDAGRLEEIEALQRVTRRLEGKAPVVVVTQEFNAAAVRIMVQLQITDFLVKPITTADLVRSCIRALQGPGREENTESQIYSFMPAAGGVGNTTLALQTAFQLHHSVTRGASTCVVDLNFQQGACAEYLDLEPRFDITEIENQPERLDRQLLDVMLSKHSSGLCVLAAPTRPRCASTRSPRWAGPPSCGSRRLPHSHSVPRLGPSGQHHGEYRPTAATVGRSARRPERGKTPSQACPSSPRTARDRG